MFIYGDEMGLSIRNEYAEKLARDSAKRSGKSITQVIITALEDYLRRIKGNSKLYDLEKEILNISNRCKELPELDKRTADEILEYSTFGIPE